MFHRKVCWGVLVAAALAGVPMMVGAASAAPISVGSGVDTAEVLFNWPDGFVADYDVHFGTSPTSTISGYDASQAALADTNLSLSWSNFGTVSHPNFFLNIASYTGGHTGDGDTFDFDTAPSNFWHEWIDDGGGWTFGGGASADLLSNNQRIGWVFGTEATPVPEPIGAIFMLGGIALNLRRRREGGAR